MSTSKTALVAVESDISRDPRVHRQIEWLRTDGWTIDSIGLGETSAPGVRDHFTMSELSAWKLSTFGTAVMYGLLSHRKKFELLTLARFPDEVRRRVREGRYDLVLLNDRHFAPWVQIARDFTPAALRGHIHLDLHEYFVPRLARNTLWRIATAGYYEWSRAQFGDKAFTTRSTVNTGIARLYAAEFGITEPAVIRNSPPYVDQGPHPVDANHIKLLHHGSARPDRGLKEMVEALRLMEPRFSITLMLVGSEEFLSDLADSVADLGNRVRIVPPVPMTQLAEAINPYDLEVMFYAPRTRNLELALPNKLFEAVQGRLGLVIGESPMMVDIVERHSNGVVVRGWEPHDLAAAMNALSAEDVTLLKEASNRAARALSAENERDVFLSVVGSKPQGALT